MAELHNALKRSPIADGIKTAIGQHRQGEGGLERWGETLQPVINAWGMPEWAFLRKERLGAVLLPATLVAAEFGYCGLHNPAGSGSIVVVDSVSVGSSTAIQAHLTIGPYTAVSGTLVTTPGVASLRDRRWAGTAGQTQLVTGTDPSASLLTNLEYGFVPTGSVYVYSTCLPVVLRPGDVLCIVGQTVNITIYGSFGWRERKAFPGELT